MFCLLLHPPLWGKGKCSGMANFGQVFLYEIGLRFLGRMHSSGFQWEKARWKKRAELLAWKAEVFLKCGWVVLTFLRLSWGNCWSYWEFLVWERSRAGLSWEQRAGVIIARSQEVEWQLAGCPGLSLGAQEHRRPQQGMSRRVTSGNWDVRALGLDSHWFTGCPQWDFSGWEVANTMLFWDCCSLCEKELSSDMQPFCWFRSWASSALLTVEISLQELCIYCQCCCSKTDSFWDGI